MSRLVDLMSIGALMAAALAFVLGVRALGDGHDLHALYWLAVGGLVLRAAVDMLRPRTGGR